METPSVPPADRVWQFWCGPRPVWIDACLRLMAAIHGPRYRLLSAEDLAEFGLEQYWSRLDPAQLSDLMRFAVLARYGGTYVDADFAPTGPLRLSPGFSDVAVSGGSSDAAHAARKLEPNLLWVSRPNHPLILRTCEEQLKNLETYGRRWGFIASPAFLAARDAKQSSQLSIGVVPWRKFAIVPCDRYVEYSAPFDYRVLSWLRSMHGCMFWNSGMRGFAGAMTLSGVLKSQGLMAGVLRACCYHAVNNYAPARDDALVSALAGGATRKERACWRW